MSTETKFTKGDWTQSYGTLVSIGGYEWELKNCADASLIAAAPKMYEEIECDIQVLKQQLEYAFIDDILRVTLKSKLSHKEKLLAQARGE